MTQSYWSAARIMIVTSGVVATLACGSATRDGADEGATAASTQQAISTAIDLVSPATCNRQGTKYVGCTIGPKVVAGVPMSTAVPLRTRFTVQKSGNCSTGTPLEVTFSADGAESVKLPFLAGGSATIKRRDGEPLPNVTISDSSPWTRTILLDSTCAVGLKVVSNEVDVNSAEEAQAILDRLAGDLDAKTRIRDHYQHLALYHSAFRFLRSVSNNLLVELTNDTIQQLRLSANDALSALSTMMGSCDATLTDKDRQNLMILLMSLPQLGQASDWQTDAGATKTLADLLGAKQAEVLATVQKLADAAGDDGGLSSYDTDYQGAARDVETARAKLDQARQQLAPWQTNAR